MNAQVSPEFIADQTGHGRLKPMPLHELWLLPRSKVEAKAIKSKYFFTGAQCKQGHLERRYANDSKCVTCSYNLCKSWSERNVEKKNALLREWCANNKDRKNACPSRQKFNPETKKKWMAENIEKVRASYRRYYQKNKEKWPAKVRNRYAKAKNAEGSHTAADIAEILKLQHGRCAYCRVRLGKKYHVDHIIALDCGGSNDRSNLQILCPTCNLKKGTKHPIDFARQLGMLI